MNSGLARALVEDSLVLVGTLAGALAKRGS